MIPFLTLLACKDETPGDPREFTERTARIAAIADANNDFAFDVLQATRADVPDNLFFSPFSISSALGMTYGGAGGDTAQQLHDVLHVGLDDAAFHETLGAYVHDVGGEHERAYTLDVANRLFVDQSFPLQPAFVTLTTDTYGAPVAPVDFVGDPDGARAAVNGWVSDQTRGTIDALLPAGSITSDSRIVLANAIYFLGDWTQAFEPSSTTDQLFHAPSGDRTVPMMLGNPAGDEPLLATINDDFSMIRLPYQSDELSMLLILPTDPATPLADLEPTLDAARLQALVDALQPAYQTTVQLPRFELRTQLELAPALKSLGMTDAFDFALADFSPLSATTEDFAIAEVFHEAFVSVDEHGTEASAASGVHGHRQLFSYTPPFVADRPFLFAIRDDLTGTILFLGRLVEP